MDNYKNLIERHAGSDIKEKFDLYKPKIKGFTEFNAQLNLKAGDVVTFWGGYNGDIDYTSEILGFDEEGLAYMFWDCYWYPVDLNKRIIN